jgi:hypothetical protein
VYEDVVMEAALHDAHTHRKYAKEAWVAPPATATDDGPSP